MDEEIRLKLNPLSANSLRIFLRFQLAIVIFSASFCVESYSHLNQHLSKRRGSFLFVCMTLTNQTIHRNVPASCISVPDDRQGLTFEADHPYRISNREKWRLECENGSRFDILSESRQA